MTTFFYEKFGLLMHMLTVSKKYDFFLGPWSAQNPGTPLSRSATVWLSSWVYCFHNTVNVTVNYDTWRSCAWTNPSDKMLLITYTRSISLNVVNTDDEVIPCNCRQSIHALYYIDYLCFIKYALGTTQNVLTSTIKLQWEYSTTHTHYITILYLVLQLIPTRSV